MVASSGNGMMAGKLEIRGTIDTKDLEKGFAKIEVGFANMRKDSKSTVTDLTKMDLIGKGLERSLLAVGAAASGMIAQAAKSAPALAGSMARIKVSWDSTIRSLGVGLEPVFNKVAGFMEGMSNWASSHPDLFATVVGGIATTAAAAGLVKLLGLGPALVAAGAALSPFLAPIAAGTILAALVYLTATGKLGAGMPTINQITSPATQAIQNTVSPVTGPLTDNMRDITSGARLNNNALTDLLHNISAFFSQGGNTVSMRTMVMGQNNTFFNSTG